MYCLFFSRSREIKHSGETRTGYHLFSSAKNALIAFHDKMLSGKVFFHRYEASLVSLYIPYQSNRTITNLPISLSLFTHKKKKEQVAASPHYPISTASIKITARILSTQNTSAMRIQSAARPSFLTRASEEDVMVRTSCLPTSHGRLANYTRADIPSSIITLSRASGGTDYYKSLPCRDSPLHKA